MLGLFYNVLGIIYGIDIYIIKEVSLGRCAFHRKENIIPRKPAPPLRQLPWSFLRIMGRITGIIYNMLFDNTWKNANYELYLQTINEIPKVMDEIKWMTDSAILNKIGEHIKDWRLEMNLSQVDLANKTQLSIATIYQIESGKGTSLQNLIKVLRILDRLDALSMFLQEKEISPLEFQKLESGIKHRKRASKTKSNDTDNNGTSLW